ncbi:MAG: UDP-N-acetylmuramoyl-L-alanyl-D-glutamate--2,6-diaminopimelate ligase [Planctomycetes bacterium TMED75]|nr:UDP-N-acetylmuramoyl-L-alanyl-D-glutamate--2,6-diaminopimelate ligase [Planctomycetaceae bacterium]OUU96860.1 MAG: UDP-N-acetylmuramoyl-L-alanyl-D-glutamate--2,6-diaminopimelate ligase [Planctomycetes bacterium TMED75]
MTETNPTIDSLRTGLAGVSGCVGDGSWRPADVVEDSRQVRPGALFIARCGTVEDGARFIDQALEAGAAGVLATEPAIAPFAGDPRLRAVVHTTDPATVGARLAHRFHGSPAQSLDVLAITGTNGKTTVAWFIRALLHAAGRSCGLVGTIETDDGRERAPARLTTPSACELAAALGRMVANGCDSVVLEASSHALHQGRLLGVVPKIAIFTNLSGDHLDYHGTLADYASAKATLFSQLGPDGCAVVNADDPAHQRMVRGTSARILRCTTTDRAADARVRIAAIDRAGTDLCFEGACGSLSVRVPLVGRHNAENLVLALTAIQALGIDPMRLRSALSQLPAPPGRLEPVTEPDAPFSVLVDYAHTDDALHNVLSAVRPLVPETSRLTVVFGCGGDRDRSKRPRMAAVAASIADRIVVTSDNPRTEDPHRILEEVLAGVPAEAAGRVVSEVDRDRAIRRALSEATPGEIVLIAGKGHEDYQIIGTRRRAFDDRLIARSALAAEGGA